MANPLLWGVVLLCDALVWVPLVRDLLDDVRSRSPVPSRRRQRLARAAAAARRSRVTGPAPGCAVGTGHPPDRTIHAPEPVRRDMPVADAVSAPASAIGFHPATGRQEK